MLLSLLYLLAVQLLTYFSWPKLRNMIGIWKTSHQILLKYSCAKLQKNKLI